MICKGCRSHSLDRRDLYVDPSLRVRSLYTRIGNMTNTEERGSPARRHVVCPPRRPVRLSSLGSAGKLYVALAGVVGAGVRLERTRIHGDAEEGEGQRGGGDLHGGRLSREGGRERQGRQAIDPAGESSPGLRRPRA